LPVARLDLAQIATLEFRAPDLARYPALRLAREVMETRGHAGAVFNAAKEVALDGFIAGRIGFMDMATVVERSLDAMASQICLSSSMSNLEDVRTTDHMSRKTAWTQIAQMEI
jgi:1-deoxy-D-xylulose-5-phosphate reductoisomerase